MLMFLSNTAFMLLSLTALGCAGWFVVAPFAPNLRWPMLATPFCGLIILPALTLAAYVYLRLPFVAASLVALILCVGASAVQIILNGLSSPRIMPKISLEGLALMVLMAAVATLFMLCFTYTSLRVGTLTLVFLDGTDHAGYAQLADWLRQHTVDDRPKLDISLPEQSWPLEMFIWDPRFGSFALVALVSLIRGTSGLFAYESACALCVCCAVLALAGVFVHRWTSLLLALMGLSTAYWIDYGFSGFFGKMVGFPAALFLLALVLQSLSSRKVLRSEVFGSLIILALSAGLLYPGLLCAVLIIVCGGIFCIADMLWQTINVQKSLAPENLVSPTKPAAILWQNFMVLALCAFVVLAASGTLGRPVQVGWPDFHVAWAHIWPRLFDLEHQSARLNGLPGFAMKGAFFLSLAMWGGLLVACFLLRNAKALALVLGPMLVIVILYAFDLKTSAFQLLGVAWPLMVLTAVVLLDTARLYGVAPRLQHAVVIGLVLAIGLHAPRLFGSLRRYDSAKTQSDKIYRADEMAALVQQTAGQSVEVDVADDPQKPLIAMLTLLPKALPHWAPATWGVMVGYRSWPAPIYGTQANLRLQSINAPLPEDERRIILRTQNFVLVKNTP